MRRHKDGIEWRPFLPSETTPSGGGDSGRLGRWEVDVPVGEAAGNAPRDNSQPFFCKAICIGSMEIAFFISVLDNNESLQWDNCLFLIRQ